MNLPGGDLGGDDLVRGSEEHARIRVHPSERAKDELGHRHVRSGLDAVARDVAEHDGEAPVRQHEVVVDVAADVDARGRFVDVPDLEPGEIRHLARQQGSLHRVRELLLLPVKTGVVDCERGLPGDRESRVGDLAGDRSLGMEGDDREGGEQLPGGLDRNDRGRRTLLEEGSEQGVRTLESRSRPRVEQQRRPPLQQLLPLRAGERLRPREERPRRRVDATSLTSRARATKSTPRSSGIRITAASTPSSVTIERARTSSVVCSDRLCAKVPEIS